MLDAHKNDIRESHRSEVAHVTDKVTVALEKVSLNLTAEINNKFNDASKTTRLLLIIQFLTAAIVGGGFVYVLSLS